MSLKIVFAQFKPHGGTTSLKKISKCSKKKEGCFVGSHASKLGIRD